MTMALDGYFDESERHGQANGEPMSVAGYIFKPTAYRRFCREWRRMLAAGPSRTTHFHMTHLYARSYEYEGWTVEDRAKVLALAVDAVKANMLCGISVLFRQTDFERYAPPLWRFNQGSMYSTSCQMVLNATRLWMDDNKSFLPIAYAFESGHRFWNEADDVMAGIGKNPELKKLFRYRTHFALDKEESFGLQAADLLSWVMTRFEAGVPNNHSMRAFKPIFHHLVSGDSQKYQIFRPVGNLMKAFSTSSRLSQIWHRSSS
jgi:hypothetical protein